MSRNSERAEKLNEAVRSLVISDSNAKNRYNSLLIHSPPTLNAPNPVSWGKSILGFGIFSIWSMVVAPTVLAINLLNIKESDKKKANGITKYIRGAFSSALADGVNNVLIIKPFKFLVLSGVGDHEYDTRLIHSLPDIFDDDQKISPKLSSSPNPSLKKAQADVVGQSPHQTMESILT